MFGIPLGITRYVSYYVSKNKSQSAASVIKIGTMISVGLSVVLSIIMVLSAGRIAAMLNHQELVNLIKVLAIGLPFFSLLTCLEKGFDGLKKMKYGVTATTVLHSIKIGALAVLLGLGFKEEGAAISYVLGTIVSSILALYLIEKKVFPFIKVGIASFQDTKVLLSYSWPLIISEVVTPVISWTDSIMLGYFFSTADVGLYNISMTTATLLIIIFTSFNVITFPTMSQHVAQNDRKAMKEEFQVIASWILILTLPVIVMCLLFPKEILTLLYGTEFGGGSLVFVLLTIAYVVTVFGGPLGSIELALGKTVVSMMNVTATAVLNLVLNIILIPKFNIVGAAVASMISLIFIVLLRGAEVFYWTRITALSKRMIKPVCAAVISSGIIWGGVILFIENMRALYIIPISLMCALIYIILMIKVFKLDKEEINIMSRMLEKIGLSRLWLKKKEE